MVIFGALGLVIVVIAGAWFLVLRRFDDENFEASGPLHPPWTRRKAARGREVENQQAALRARSAERQLEPEQHAGAGKAIDEAKDRGAARGWGG
jgi:hypothetical protein